MDKVLQNSEFQNKLSELLDQDWFKIGAFLKVKQHKLIAIRNDFTLYQKQENKAHEMLQEWFKIDKNPTFQKLNLAIEQIPNYNLLKKIEVLASGFCSMFSSPLEGNSKKGNFNYELRYNDLFIATPEPVFNNEFIKNIKTLKSLDWRKINKICLDKVHDDKSIELIALDYFDRNFPDCNEVIHVSSSIANNDNLDFVVSKFIDLFTVNIKSIHAVLPGYSLRHHASLLKCNVENFTYYNDENRIIIFLCKLNLVIIARVATSTDNLKLEYKSCLNDVILFVNVNHPLIHNIKLIILGIVVLPLHDRKVLKEELFFHFSESFDLDQILFLCKDDMEDENFEIWWRSVVEYCYKKVMPQNNEILFKKLISLAMMPMAYVNQCYPTLESDTQKQIQSLILNVEQRNAINDKALKKIITGGYGSGKSIVGKEIVKNFITQNSENPFTLYYICCNHFSLYECHMKEFVVSIEKTSNVEVVCDNLYNLWKNMCQNKNILNKNISIPKLLEYLASTNSNKVCFILEELSEEYVKEEDAAQIKHLFTSILKESLVVFIPESVTKNRELVTNKQKRTLQKNFFQEDVIGMKVISLKKSMRVTECNKLIIDIAQKTICETKSVLNIQKQNLRILQENKKNNLLEGEDLQIGEREDLIFFSENDSENITTISVKNYEKDDKKSNDTSHFDMNDTIKVIKDNNYPSVENKKDNKSDQSSERVENKFNESNDFYDFDLDYMAKKITKSAENIDPNNYMETEYVFKSSIIGHSIRGEKPKVVYLPFDDITDKQSVKLLSIMLEKLCFNVSRKTVVICNDMEEVQSLAYAIDIIENFNAVTYSPHLQQYSPSLETKFHIKNKLKNDMDVLVADCKGFSGEESESVIVFVSPEEIFLRHLLVNAISRSNSNLTVFVKNFKGYKELLDKDKTIGNVLINWSEEKIVEEITIATSNAENRKSMDVFFVINENCKVFIDRGYTKDFEEYKKKSQFKIFHENNFIYETMASDLSNQVKQEFKKETSSSLEISSGFSANKGLSRMSAKLKKYYLKYYSKVSEFQPLLKTSTNVDLLHQFVDLCIVDAVKTQKDVVFSVEQKEFLEKQVRYTAIPYSEVFMNEKRVILISGIAGIGKTWLLRKCLLDWSNDLIWKNVELVFYLECRRINQYPNISNITELLNVFYKEILNDFNISNHTALFIIDGLNEFKYFNELSNLSLTCNYPIVKALKEIQKYKHVIAGRVYAIDQYQSLSTKHSDKLTIQIMGFNENGIMNYVESHVSEENKEIVKSTLKDSPIAKAMASVPFYLSSMCKFISNSKKVNTNSFLTMTDLYANIFLCFLKHIIKNDEMIYQIMKNNSDKMFILNICKIAYQLFVENKIIFSKEEIETFIDDFDKNEVSFFGFIEKFETNLGYYYQFAHLTIMEFCSSVYAYNCLSCDEIMANDKLKSCLSMICVLANKSQNSLIKFLVELNPSKNPNEKSILLFSILDHLCKRDDNKDLFIECFYESQSSFTIEIKLIVDKIKWWSISIKDGKTSYKTSCENYFVSRYIASGGKLAWLEVDKNILSDEEEDLCIQCSRNVRDVHFHHPINFKRWKPKHNIEWLFMHISKYIITKNDFETNSFSWINLCEGLELNLHDDIDFFDDIYKCICCSNIKEFLIEYRGKYFVTSIN